MQVRYRKFYAEVIQDMKVETVLVKWWMKNGKTAVFMEVLRKCRKKAKEGYFVRDPERNLVYCPAGEILRQKSIKKNGNIRYANKNACKHCPNRNKCYKGKGEWKEIDFTKDQLVNHVRAGWKPKERSRRKRKRVKMAL